MNLCSDTLWITENFVSLVEARERTTGEWLGSDAIVDDREVDEPWLNLDEYDAEQIQQAYDNFIYGE